MKNQKKDGDTKDASSMEGKYLTGKNLEEARKKIKDAKKKKDEDNKK